MPTKMIVRMNSGYTFDVPLDEKEAANLSADDCAAQFFDKVAISEMVTMRIGSRIIFMREVALFQFA